MNNIKKFVKENKIMTSIIGIIIIFIIVVGITVKAFFPSGNSYGNRLDGIEKYEMTKETISKLEKEITDDEDVSKTKISIKGRLINVIINVESADLDDMQNFCKQKLDLFEEEELNYYDIQFYLIDETNDDYPSIGYKHKTSDKIVWNKN